MLFTRALTAFTVLLLFFSGSLHPQVLNRPPQREIYNFPLLPKWSDAAVDSVARYDFTVVLRDGVVLDALKFIPLKAAPPGGWPTVIMVHGYGDNKETLAGFCKAQSEYGYYTTTFSMRGQGYSGGLSNLISTIEAQDMAEFVSYIKRDSVNGSNPGNILVMGGSQGGLVPMMAASRFGMNVRTMISALAPANFATSWIENGSIKMTLLWTVEYTPDTARYTPLVDRMSDWIYANNKEKWDSLAYWLPRDRDFMSYVPFNKVPLIVEGSWQDKFFNASGLIRESSMMQAPFRLYIGAVQGHGGDQSAAEDQWHMQFFNDWFFYWLFNVPNGVLDLPKYEYASTVFPVVNKAWTFIHDSSRVPFANITSNVRFYFNSSNRLRTTPNPNKTAVSIRNRITGGLTMTEAVNEEFTGKVFDSKFKKASIYFQTSPLSSDMKWLGTPKLNLNYSSTAGPFCQFNFQVFEVKPDGTSELVNRINYTDRNYSANSKKTANFEGQAHSHVFKAGNRIKVVVTNFDWNRKDSAFLGTNPFVLPVLINAYNYIHLNSNSYVELPFVSPPPTIVFDENESEDELLPYRYALNQNYPNPFNPVTAIGFSLRNSGLVTLKIYDILGREVVTLINEFREAGPHEVFFDGTDLSSGVYFYRVEAGSYTDVKRMVILK